MPSAAPLALAGATVVHPAAAPHQPWGPASPPPVPVTIARGDGIGPEIMQATLAVLEAAGARLEIEEIEVGERLYRRGLTSGIGPEAWESIRRTRVFLKAPITTPQGGGYKSLNVTMRKALGLYANVRPCVAYAPVVATRHPGLDLVIVRENEEDTYGGIEHRQTREVTQCLKLITRPGCERIARYAFAYARAAGRRKVTCMTKDNIMKLTDGLFRRTVEQVASEYPDIAYEHMIVDIGAARLADTPDRFDVVVLPNLYGDILSDVAAQIAGSVGLAGSANIGDAGAMFEAIHGSAPDLAGRDVANPSGLLHAALLMLRHVGQGDVAARVHDAWLRALEDGVHTADVHDPDATTPPVGTQDFAEAVIARLGLQPQRLARAPETGAMPDASEIAARAVRVPVQREVKALVGVDVFVDWDEPGRSPDALAARLQDALAGSDLGERLRLAMITNRGTKVWPDGMPETFRTDHWRCRFVAASPDAPPSSRTVAALLGRLAAAELDVVKTENLYTFDGVPGYSRGQGE